MLRETRRRSQHLLSGVHLSLLRLSNPDVCQLETTESLFGGNFPHILSLDTILPLDEFLTLRDQPLTSGPLELVNCDCATGAGLCSCATASAPPSSTKRTTAKPSFNAPFISE